MKTLQVEDMSHLHDNKGFDVIFVLTVLLNLSFRFRRNSFLRKQWNWRNQGEGKRKRRSKKVSLVNIFIYSWYGFSTLTLLEQSFCVCVVKLLHVKIKSYSMDYCCVQPVNNKILNRKQIKWFVMLAFIIFRLLQNTICFAEVVYLLSIKGEKKDKYIQKT